MNACQAATSNAKFGFSSAALAISQLNIMEAVLRGIIVGWKRDDNEDLARQNAQNGWGDTTRPPSDQNLDRPRMAPPLATPS